MFPQFTPALEQQMLELRQTSLNSEDFWTALDATNSPYLEYIWRQQWLPGHLSPREVWQAASAMADPATSLRLWQFPHKQLAEQLPLARQLEAQRVPGLVEYANYMLEQADAKGQLHMLMQQVQEAEAADVEYMLARMAAILLNRVLLCVGVQRYRLRDIEFYYHRPEVHHDPYVHGEAEQQQLGRWYYNRAGGLDLTFGSREHGAWGGILLRGLEKVPPSPECYPPSEALVTGYVSGVQKVLCDIIAHLNGVFEAPRGIELDEIQGTEPLPVWRVRRHNLKHKPEEDANKAFLERRYRFLVDKNYLASLKAADRTAVLKQLTPAEAQAAL